MEDARSSWVERERKMWARKEDGGGDKKEICRNKAKKELGNNKLVGREEAKVSCSKAKKCICYFSLPLSFLPSFSRLLAVEGLGGEEVEKGERE